MKLPDKCPVKQIQGRVSEVYEQKTIAGKGQQRFVLEDAGGNRLYVSAWEHSDLSFYKGKEVVLSEGPKGGLSVNIYNGKTSLNLSRTCSFQLLAVHQAQTGASATPAVSPAVDVGSGVEVKVTGAPGAPTPINGAKVGMALNNATLVLSGSGKLAGLAPGQILPVIGQMASDIIRLSNWLEQGHLYPITEKITEPTSAKADPALVRAATPASDPLDKDMPF